LRKGEIIQVFDETPEEVQELARIFERDARNPTQCLKSLGLDAHPNIQEYLNPSGEYMGIVPHDEAAAIIYRADSWSQSQYYPHFQTPPLPPFLDAPGAGVFSYESASLDLIQLARHTRLLVFVE